MARGHEQDSQELLSVPKEGEGDETAPEYENDRLNEVIKFYDCADLLPLAHHVLWLAAVSEATGSLDRFDLDYLTIRLLVILKEEQSKKSALDMQQAQQSRRSSTSASSGLDGVITR